LHPCEFEYVREARNIAHLLAFWHFDDHREGDGGGKFWVGVLYQLVVIIFYAVFFGEVLIKEGVARFEFQLGEEVFGQRVIRMSPLTFFQGSRLHHA
jgi:hypothetical protein